MLALYYTAVGWLFATASATAQVPFHTTTNGERDNLVNAPADSQFYQFKWPIRKVAIIGAGVSGLLAYRELVDAGFSHIRIFERDAVPGGNWHYTDDVPDKAPIPNEDPRIADYEPTLPPPGAVLPFERWYDDRNDSMGMSTAERWRRHRAPQPLYKSLTSNVPAPLMHFSGHDWPPGVPWHLPYRLLQGYLRGVFSYHGINSNDDSPVTSYSTRVELVEKRHDERGWTLTLKKFVRLGAASCKEVWWTEDFDAVIVATGTFNAPNIPNIPGLAEWARRSPESILHSREYRDPKVFANQSVLVVGAGTSATAISADLQSSVKTNYISVRPSKNSTTPPVFLNLLHHDVNIVGGIARFHPDNASIELADGTFLTEIDRIIFATGYQFTFPFLPQYHNSSIGLDEEGPMDKPQPLVTDGSHYRSLYLEFLYIEEPTLAFMNMNLGTVTWTLGEYFALAIAKVWSGKAMLPSQAEMWRVYREGVKARGGYGKGILFLGMGGNTGYVNYFTGWLNMAAYEYGGKTIDGLTKDWKEILGQFALAWLHTNPNPPHIPGSGKNHSDSEGKLQLLGAGAERKSSLGEDVLQYLISGY
ncbi:hypothetical protein FB45DRAFT_919211 [Roridomyces roridus]|uniref:FAD/NAD(P)-binding domain-containing protein n=1 Tax=Roridomyces roridus TaxID=1738132 RepID=A0AAD7BRN5_9AGAR|nr:hypothetical protein FB45DRAFT_919211 [Roridomyces roridus]